ncbi:MAG: hypothetical protein KDC79_16765 [Cyclobacteriaceae bacterium]|nr:hypothetical protein [Cyclobacteriaceae bacterium]
MVTILISFLLSCSKKGEGILPKSVYTISTVEDLKEFVSGINFEVTMPNGQIINFTSAKAYTNMNSTHFTSIDGGFNFSDLDPYRIQQSQGNAKLQFDDKLYKFNMVVCITMKELEDYFKGYTVDPNLYDWLVYFAADGGDYTNEELVLGTPISETNFLNVLVSPMGETNQYFYGSFYTPNWNFYRLSSSDLSLNGKDIKSFGSIYWTNQDLWYYYTLDINYY